MKTDGEGIYVLVRAYIAFRDNNDNKWRLNLIRSDVMNDPKHSTLDFMGDFEHLWQIHEYIEKHPR